LGYITFGLQKNPSFRVKPSISRVDPSINMVYTPQKSGQDLYSVFIFSKLFTTLDILVKMKIRRGGRALFSTLALCRKVNV